VETLDARRQLLYRQTWTNNMTMSLPPEIVSLQENIEQSSSNNHNNNGHYYEKQHQDNDDYTCISFVPDVARLTGVLSTTTIPPQDYAVMCRRVLLVVLLQLQVRQNNNMLHLSK
jgi:hypothetical protein